MEYENDYAERLEEDMDRENQDMSFDQEQSERFQDKLDMYRNEY